MTKLIITAPHDDENILAKSSAAEIFKGLNLKLFFCGGKTFFCMRRSSAAHDWPMQLENLT